jgi:hypothetical protein
LLLVVVGMITSCDDEAMIHKRKRLNKIIIRLARNKKKRRYFEFCITNNIGF